MADGAPMEFAEAARRAVYADGPPVGRRIAAFERFAEAGPPHRRIENWRWSDFAAALRTPTSHETPTQSITIDDAYVIRIDGMGIHLPHAVDRAALGFDVELVEAASVADEIDNPLTALAIAAAPQTLRISVRPRTQTARPILIERAAGADVTGARIEVILGREASATIVEAYAGAAPAFTSLSFDLGPDADLTRVTIDDGGPAAVRYVGATLKAWRGARIAQTSLSDGGRLTRQETAILAHGGNDIRLDTISLCDAGRTADVTSRVDHMGQGATVRQRHKAVVRARGRAIFQGKFFVDRDGQQTDAEMNAAAILLDVGAEARHKPELEIYADDVQCAHGSTVGALDESAIFYLRQRGLSLFAARRMLIDAFVAALIDDAPETMRSPLRDRMDAWLKGGG